ncbi:gametogenetin-like [Lepisosteus oculatus]|uniref:gametogenetin-like n=1 Tax=Lepisosteus oculatus TaxID=7918 RepID=UPI003712786E
MGNGQSELQQEQPPPAEGDRESERERGWAGERERGRERGRAAGGERETDEATGGETQPGEEPGWALRRPQRRLPGTRQLSPFPLSPNTPIKGTPKPSPGMGASLCPPQPPIYSRHSPQRQHKLPALFPTAPPPPGEGVNTRSHVPQIARGPPGSPKPQPSLLPLKFTLRQQKSRALPVPLLHPSPSKDVSLTPLTLGGDKSPQPKQEIKDRGVCPRGAWDIKAPQISTPPPSARSAPPAQQLEGATGSEPDAWVQCQHSQQGGMGAQPESNTCCSSMSSTSSSSSISSFSSWSISSGSGSSVSNNPKSTNDSSSTCSKSSIPILKVPPNFVMSEKTRAQLDARLRYLQQQQLVPPPPVSEVQAAVRRAMKAASYSEAVRAPAARTAHRAPGAMRKETFAPASTPEANPPTKPVTAPAQSVKITPVTKLTTNPRGNKAVKPPAQSSTSHLPCSVGTPAAGPRVPTSSTPISREEGGTPRQPRPPPQPCPTRIGAVRQVARGRKAHTTARISSGGGRAGTAQAKKQGSVSPAGGRKSQPGSSTSVTAQIPGPTAPGTPGAQDGASAVKLEGFSNEEEHEASSPPAATVQRCNFTPLPESGDLASQRQPQVRHLPPTPYPHRCPSWGPEKPQGPVRSSHSLHALEPWPTHPGPRSSRLPGPTPAQATAPPAQAELKLQPQAPCSCPRPTGEEEEEEEEREESERRSSPSAPDPPRRPQGRWPSFHADPSCSRQARCHHHANAPLPHNVAQWLAIQQNFLCEPAWVTTVTLAASLVARATLRSEGGDTGQ